jgi:dTMP kinase
LPARCYGQPPPGLDPSELHGRLYVIEGADGSGRSTQIRLLREWLEGEGHAVVDFGLARSSLVSTELNNAKDGNILGHMTRSLFYATDFMDQMENVIVPALRAGFVCLCDRYVYTLMARDVVRGAGREWVESLYSIALMPDAVFYLRVSPQILVERNFMKNQTLDHWESGMDLGLSPNMFESFIKYQRLIQREFARMQETYAFQVVDGNRSQRAVLYELKRAISAHLDQSVVKARGG